MATGTDKAQDYRLSVGEAESLLGAVLLPGDIRADLLTRYHREHGAEALIGLFAQFIGLANSVVANNREMIEVIGIVSGDLHPHTAGRINLPTIFGALQGVVLAARVPQTGRLCGGCAFRLGSPANQSPSTTTDADHCRQDGVDFMCHEDLDEKGEPLRVCRGHALSTNKRRAA